MTEDRVFLPNQLDRKLYEQVNKALVAAGGKWNRSSKAHVFTGNPLVKLGLALETGKVVDEKKLYQAFYTPPELARMLVLHASVEGKIVLEPSSGDGALVDACFDAGAASVHAVELNPEAFNQLAAPKKPRPNSFRAVFGDFLSTPPPCVLYERIVMNPPFTRGADIKHLERALKFLAPGGVCVCVLMGDKVSVKERLLCKTGQGSCVVYDCPADSFKESGTSIKTSFAVIAR
jgi:predicted RNA methylase